MTHAAAKLDRLTETFLMASVAFCASTGLGADPPDSPRAQEPSRDAGATVAELFQKLSPAVVKILVNGESHKGVASGSGFVVAWPTPNSCEIVTNYHVIRAAVDAAIEFDNGAIGDVDKVLMDKQSADLALLAIKLRKRRDIHPSWPADTRARMEAKQPPEGRATQRVIDVNAVARPPVGTRVIAIGSPMGMTNTLSDGLISGYRKDGPSPSWVQITNPISHGSSGGPLFTEEGTFVGITTASLEDAQNLNFAIPAEMVRTFLDTERAPREVWKGSCIRCEEDAVYREVFDNVLDRFCASSDEFNHEREKADDYFRAVNGVAPALTEPNRRFRRYCEDLAATDDPYALIVYGYYTAGEATFGNPERLRVGINSLTRAVELTEQYRFFALYAIGAAEWHLQERRASAALGKTVEPGAFARTLAYLNKAREADPGFVPTLEILAWALTESGQHSAALSVNSDLLKRVPNSAKAHIQRAEILASTGSRLEALSEFRAAASLDPHEWQAAFRLGQLYSETGQHEYAIASYESAIRIAEDNSTKRAMEEVGLKASGSVYAPFIWQVRRSIGWEYTRLGRFDEALAMFEHALRSPGVDGDPRIIAALQQDIATCLQIRNTRR